MTNLPATTSNYIELEPTEEAVRLLEACKEKPHLDGEYFEVDLANSSNAGSIVAFCQLCKPKCKIKGTLQSSSNFLQHLKRKHPQEYGEDFQNYKKLKNVETVEKGHAATRKRNDACSFSQSTFESNVTRYILNSMAPFSTVEMQSFQKIFDDMNIRKNGRPLKHMSRRTLERNVGKLFTEQMDNIRKDLKKKAFYVCTTADIWTANSRRFLGVTVHWINRRNFDRRSAAIACRRFPGTHTYDRIAKLLEEIHTSFGLDLNKIVATVTDNASNFTKAFKEFGVDIYDDRDIVLTISDTLEVPSETEEDSDFELEIPSSAESTMLSPDEYAIPDNSDEDGASFNSLPKHFKCASHTLNLLATTDVLKTMKASKPLSLHFSQVMARCQCLWKVLRSPKQREILTNVLGQCLSRPVVVRWNSLFSSLQQIYNLREKINEANQVLSIATPLRESDYKFISEYLTCLRPVAEAIDILQGEKQCFYGYLLPSIVSLRRKLQHIEQHGNLEYCQMIAFDLIQNLERRFHDFFEVEGTGVFAAVAAVLQPQFKTRWVRCLSFGAQERVKEAAMEAAKKASESSRSQQLNDDNPSRISHRSDGYDFGEDDEMIGSENLVLEESQTELQMRTFMSDPCCPDMSVINKYPEITDLFLRYNTPLPSSAPVERLFSYATMMNLPRYNRLTDENFEKRTLAKCNSVIFKVL